MKKLVLLAALSLPLSPQKVPTTPDFYVRLTAFNDKYNEFVSKLYGCPKPEKTVPPPAVWFCVEGASYFDAKLWKETARAGRALFTE